MRMRKKSERRGSLPSAPRGKRAGSTPRSEKVTSFTRDIPRAEWEEWVHTIRKHGKPAPVMAPWKDLVDSHVALSRIFRTKRGEWMVVANNKITNHPLKTPGSLFRILRFNPKTFVMQQVTGAYSLIFRAGEFLSISTLRDFDPERFELIEPIVQESVKLARKERMSVIFISVNRPDHAQMLKKMGFTRRGKSKEWIEMQLPVS
ncbi:MAG: hypothetical protein AABX02_04555, partial [archaeon]